MVVTIEDELHAESQGEYPSVEAAFRELIQRAQLPWDKAPNQCPCANWRTCGRRYEILVFDDSVSPWRPLLRLGILSVSGKGVEWSADFSDGRLSYRPDA